MSRKRRSCSNASHLTTAQPRVSLAFQLKFRKRCQRLLEIRFLEERDTFTPTERFLGRLVFAFVEQSKIFTEESKVTFQQTEAGGKGRLGGGHTHPPISSLRKAASKARSLRSTAASRPLLEALWTR